MDTKNRMTVKFPSLSRNESFARSVAGIFVLQLNPSVAQLSDVKTAVSEAVTNCIVHAYRDTEGIIEITARILSGNEIYIRIKDMGCGIADIE